MKHRYFPYYETKNYNDNFKQPYKRLNQCSSVRHDNNNKNQMDLSNEQSNVNNYSYLPTQSPVPLMSNKTISSSTILPPVPQERESWIRSVKKTKIDENITQKTQYLETMLRMPQPQKSSINTSTFDRMRFANEQTPITRNIIENTNHNLDVNSYQLINDVNNDDEICAIEKILFDNELNSTTTTNQYSNQIINSEPTLQTNSQPSDWSGFLIDNCDDVQMSPMSPPVLSPIPSTINEIIQKNQGDLNQQRAILINELDVADAEQKRETKRQKRLNKKLQKKKKKKLINAQSDSNSIVNNQIPQELSSDWIVEYDVTETDQISQLTDMIKKVSTTVTDENKIDKINLILKKIKQQQRELRKLRQHVISMLDDGQKSNSINTSPQDSNNNQDLLMKFINQPTTSGCWLCSGKTYTEVTTQCNNLNE